MTPEEWRSEAYEAGLAVIRQRQEFTTDDIWRELLARDVALPKGTSARIMGRITVRLMREGKISKADRAPVPNSDVLGVGRTPHAIPVWKSHEVAA